MKVLTWISACTLCISGTFMLVYGLIQVFSHNNTLLPQLGLLSIFYGFSIYILKKYEGNR